MSVNHEMERGGCGYGGEKEDHDEVDLVAVGSS